LALLSIILISTILNDRFLTMPNILNILRQIAIVGILAIGETFAILTGGIDLSVGAILGMSVVLYAGFLENYSLWLAIPMGLFAAILIGAINGSIVAFTKVPAFIVTLGMLSFARGIAYIYSGGTPIPIINESLYVFGNGYFGGVPIPAIILIVTLIIAGFFLKYTPFGRYVYAIGSNANAAHLSGVPVRFGRISVFVISGLCAGLAGLLFASQLSVGTPVAGASYELDAIAAVVVGGTSLMGGKGSVFGTFIGVLIVGVMANILNLLGIDSFVQQLFKGVLIVFAVFLMTRSSNEKGD
jgi:ribose/xylose/arabinose/galactoside ABC-type transport system permease subunit